MAVNLILVINRFLYILDENVWKCLAPPVSGNVVFASPQRGPSTWKASLKIL